MPKQSIYIIRHGETYLNYYSRLQGWSNAPLTPWGISDVEASGRGLKDIKFTATYTTNNFWSLDLTTNMLFPNESRLMTTVAFEYHPSYFWGMGYANGNNPANKTMQKKYLANVQAELLFKVGYGFRVGPKVLWDYVNSDTIAKPELLEGQDLVLRNYGIGVAAEYDTRDMVTDAKRGCY